MGTCLNIDALAPPILRRGEWPTLKLMLGRSDLAPDQAQPRLRNEQRDGRAMRDEFTSLWGAEAPPILVHLRSYEPSYERRASPADR